MFEIFRYVDITSDKRFDNEFYNFLTKKCAIYQRQYFRAVIGTTRIGRYVAIEGTGPRRKTTTFTSREACKAWIRKNYKI